MVTLLVYNNVKQIDLATYLVCVLVFIKLSKHCEYKFKARNRSITIHKKTRYFYYKYWSMRYLCKLIKFFNVIVTSATANAFRALQM